MENGIEPKPSIPTDTAPLDTQLKSPMPQILMLVVLFLLTISIIVAGYFHGKMHLLTVLKNAFGNA
ncbi:hypothetical protein RW110999_184 [Cyanophage S-RIM4]|nr:hypothetical protein RW110999_184 [Cyanophage S-RIM4]